MNLDKLEKAVNSAYLVEELIDLSKKVFSKSSDDVKSVLELFITKSYLMGKQNMIKSVDE